MLEGAVSESKLGAGPQNVNRVLPEFQCELEAVKAGCDSTTRGREIRRMKRTYRKCISDYKLQLASEQQKLRESLSSIVMPDVRKVVIAKIDLTGKVIATEYKLPKIVGTGGNSIDVRDFYDLAHGQ